MKAASIIFIVIGAILNFYTTPTAFAVIGAIIGAITIYTLAKNQKNILVGILSLLLCGLLGGILYLAWDPEK